MHLTVDSPLFCVVLARGSDVEMVQVISQDLYGDFRERITPLPYFEPLASGDPLSFLEISQL